MILTNKQEEGLHIAVQRFRAGEKWTTISGYAGSGKTTLVKFIIDALGVNVDEDVAYTAFTGKAAEVLRQKGCPNAMTLHKLLYTAKPTPSGKFIYRPRPTLDYRVVVVDEVSMVTNDLWNLLLSHPVYIIACGDPGQLPPVDEKNCIKVLDDPHIFLDEIMRQAQESEIIRLSMDIREGKNIDYYLGNDVKVISAKDIHPGMYYWADQILVATNNKRHDVNELLRKANGRAMEPEIGDKIICNRNCWDILDTTGENALVNGTIGYIDRIEAKNWKYPHRNLPKPVPLYFVDFHTEYGEQFLNVPIDQSSILTGHKTLTSAQEYLFFSTPSLRNNEPMPIDFNFGYAITCHKAQGSQWNNVMVLEETFPFVKEEHKRWLYTAATRAADRLILVR